jgi:hypothetical protein
MLPVNVLLAAALQIFFPGLVQPLDGRIHYCAHILYPIGQPDGCRLLAVRPWRLAVISAMRGICPAGCHLHFVIRPAEFISDEL